MTDYGTNINYHNYKIWANPASSYLVPIGGGNWMRIQSYVYTKDHVIIEYYDPEFNLTDRIVVPKMLQTFGGFHQGSDGYYYLITGDGLSSENIGTDPKFDISKYDKDEKLYLQNIFELIPSELNSKNKRFILKNLNENAKFTKYNNSFLWLKNAGVALTSFVANEPKIPLILSKSANLFKLFFNDVGHFMMLVFLLCVVTYSVVVIIESSKGNRK